MSAYECPTPRESLAEECDDACLLIADGLENLGDVIARSNDDSFEPMDDVTDEVKNRLPRRAVGEPFGQGRGIGRYPTP